MTKFCMITQVIGGRAFFRGHPKGALHQRLHFFRTRYLRSNRLSRPINLFLLKISVFPALSPLRLRNVYYLRPENRWHNLNSEVRYVKSGKTNMADLFVDRTIFVTILNHFALLWIICSLEWHQTLMLLYEICQLVNCRLKSFQQFLLGLCWFVVRQYSLLARTFLA